MDSGSPPAGPSPGAHQPVGNGAAGAGTTPQNAPTQDNASSANGSNGTHNYLLLQQPPLSIRDNSHSGSRSNSTSAAGTGHGSSAADSVIGMPLHDDRRASSHSEASSASNSNSQLLWSAQNGDLTRRVPGALFRKALRIIAADALHCGILHPLALRPEMLPESIKELSAERLDKAAVFSLVPLYQRVRGLLRIRLAYLNSSFATEVEEMKKSPSAGRARARSEGVSSPRLLMHKYDVVFGTAAAPSQESVMAREERDRLVQSGTGLGSSGYAGGGSGVSFAPPKLMSTRSSVGGATTQEDSSGRTSSQLTSAGPPTPSGGSAVYQQAHQSANSVSSPAAIVTFQQFLPSEGSVLASGANSMLSGGGGGGSGSGGVEEGSVLDELRKDSSSACGGSTLRAESEPATFTSTVLYPSVLRRLSGTNNYAAFEFDREAFSLIVSGDADRALFTKIFFLDLFVNSTDFIANPQLALQSAMQNIHLRMGKVLSRSRRAVSNLSSASAFSTASAMGPFSLTAVYLRDDELFSCSMGETGMTDAELLLVRDTQDKSVILLRSEASVPASTAATPRAPPLGTPTTPHEKRPSTGIASSPGAPNVATPPWTRDVFRVLLPHAATPDGSITSNFSYESLVSIGRDRSRKDRSLTDRVANGRNKSNLSSPTLRSPISRAPPPPPPPPIETGVPRRVSGSLGTAPSFNSTASFLQQSHAETATTTGSSPPTSQYIAQFAVILTTSQFWSVFTLEEVWCFVNAMLQRFAEELLTPSSRASHGPLGAVGFDPDRSHPSLSSSKSISAATTTTSTLHGDIQNMNHDMSVVLQHEATRRLQQRNEDCETLAVTILTFM